MIDRDVDVVLGQTIAAYAKKSHDARPDSPIEFAIAETVAGGIVVAVHAGKAALLPSNIATHAYQVLRGDRPIQYRSRSALCSSAGEGSRSRSGSPPGDA